MPKQQPPRSQITDAPGPVTPAETENAFRRGFVHGAYAVITALQRGETLYDLANWLTGPLALWRGRTRKCKAGQIVIHAEPPPGVRDRYNPITGVATPIDAVR
jgi:hypothetical protein